MDTLRQRNPFKYSADSASDDTYIMDEQGNEVRLFIEVLLRLLIAEQSEYIDNLKKLNATSNSQNRIMLQITLALSILL